MLRSTGVSWIVINFICLSTQPYSIRYDTVRFGTIRYETDRILGIKDQELVVCACQLEPFQYTRSLTALSQPPTRADLLVIIIDSCRTGRAPSRFNPSDRSIHPSSPLSQPFHLFLIESVCESIYPSIRPPIPVTAWSRQQRRARVLVACFTPTPFLLLLCSQENKIIWIDCQPPIPLPAQRH